MDERSPASRTVVHFARTLALPALKITQLLVQGAGEVTDERRDAGGKGWSMENRGKCGKSERDSSTSSCSKEKRKRANRKEAVELIQRYATIQRNKRREEMETDAARVYQALLARRGPVHAEKTFAGDRA